MWLEFTLQYPSLMGGPMPSRNHGFVCFVFQISHSVTAAPAPASLFCLFARSWSSFAGCIGKEWVEETEERLDLRLILFYSSLFPFKSFSHQYPNALNFQKVTRDASRGICWTKYDMGIVPPKSPVLPVVLT